MKAKHNEMKGEMKGEMKDMKEMKDETKGEMKGATGSRHPSDLPVLDSHGLRSVISNAGRPVSAPTTPCKIRGRAPTKAARQVVQARGDAIMASLIHEGTRIGQGQRNEQVSELTMRSEPFPLAEPSAADGLTANQGDVSAALPASAPVVERSTAIDYPYESATGSTSLVSSS